MFVLKTKQLFHCSITQFWFSNVHTSQEKAIRQIVWINPDLNMAFMFGSTLWQMSRASNCRAIFTRSNPHSPGACGQTTSKRSSLQMPILVDRTHNRPLQMCGRERFSTKDEVINLKVFNIYLALSSASHLNKWLSNDHHMAMSEYLTIGRRAQTNVRGDFATR